MPPYGDGREYGEESFIAGAHGTIAEQLDEAYYDDRSEASDDMEKGRLKFPTKMYGRERELDTLSKIYERLASVKQGESNVGMEEVDDEKGKEEEPPSTSRVDLFHGSSVVFLSGYSGIGKSALVREFTRLTQSKYKSEQILYASGKYTDQRSASAPLSAIVELFDQLALALSLSSALDINKKVQSKIKLSEIIGPGAEGDSVLRATFPGLVPLLDGCFDKANEKTSRSSAHYSMNVIKECTREILSIVCQVLDHPMVVFLDDLQWADEASIDLLSYLLSSNKMQGVLFICAYRSNEVDEDHSFAKLMKDIQKTRSTDGDAQISPTVETMDLFSLSPEAIVKFIGDSVKKEEGGDEGVAELAEAVYTKTMGNIFFVKQALEELVRKNILFYDVMCFEWRWVVSKVELGNYMSDDVVETVKGKFRELSCDIQHILIVMAYIPNSLDVPVLKALMNHGEYSFDEGTISQLLQTASDEGMVIFSVESKSYIFAHDRIRQASLEIANESDQGELLIHMSQVLLDFSDHMEWCMYVSVGLRNSLPPEKLNQLDLARLNMRVAKIAKSRGSLQKENELLLKGLECLKSSGSVWKEYNVTLELYNALVLSQYLIGSFSDAGLAIDHIINNARTIDDKLPAYTTKLQCDTAANMDYKQGLTDGVNILNLYGFAIPMAISKKYMMKQDMKLKIALRGRSYSSLSSLPVKEEPIFKLFAQVEKCAMFSGSANFMKIVASKAIQYAIKRGMGNWFPCVLVMYATSLAMQGNVKTSYELGSVSVAISTDKMNDAETRGIVACIAHGSVLTQLQSFRDTVDVQLQGHKDLKVIGGDIEGMLAILYGHFLSYFAGGLELGPLLESKLLLAEELSQDLDMSGYVMSFQILRQHALNLRTRTSNPSVLDGLAFNEREVLGKLNGNALKMAQRDSSTSRIALAFTFRDDSCMAQMLNILKNYPLSDTIVARGHDRFCFMGLAAFTLCKKQELESFLEVGNNCLRFFSRLTKYGSVNAKPVYLFMLAMKEPSRLAFEKAIDACAEASMVHLQAMATERYAMFLYEENDEALAKEFITSSYWLYQDWGADAKALQLAQLYDFLKTSKRNKAKSGCSATSRVTSTTDGRRSGRTVPVYSFNSTLKIRNRIMVRKQTSME